MADFLIRQRDYLLDISRALTSQLSLSEVLRRILRSATEMLGGQAGLIALADGGGHFTVRASYGIQSTVLHLFAPLLSDIPHADPDSFFIPELDRKMRLVARAAGMGLHQVIALPMVVARELVGVVYIFRAYGGGFTRNDVQLLQSFANQAAIAVHNARLYEQVSVEKQRLDAILQHSADGVMILTADLRVERINLKLSRLTGWSVEQAEKLHHDDLIRWKRREPGLDLAGAVAGGWPLQAQSLLHVEGDIEHQSGATVSVRITYVPLFNAEGRLTNIIGDVWDITKFKEAEEAKSTFVSVISHELKTPVSLIKGYASTLRRDDAEWDQNTVRDGLAVIEEEADRLAELIDNLLDVSRVQSGTLKLSMVPLRIDRLAEQIAGKFRTQSDRHTIVTDFPPDFPPIQGDEKRLGQAISNLLGNALKYSPEGGEIRIAGRTNTDWIEIAVSDQGIGIAPEQQENIFERFYRVDNALTRETQGAGLGLFIVRSIVEAHGGHIRVESQPGQGTTFRFSLPLSQA